MKACLTAGHYRPEHKKSDTLATLNIVAAPGDYPLISERNILIANKVEGEFGKVLNNLAFLTPKLAYEEKTVDLILVRNDVTIESVATTNNGKEVAQSIEEPKDIPQAPSVAEAPNSPASADTSVPVSTPTTTAEKLSTAAIPPTTDQPATAATSPTTDQPVTAVTPPPATHSVATEPKASIPTTAAVTALLSADKQTASVAIEQLAGGQNANLAKATLNSGSKRRVAFKGFSYRPEGRYDANTQQAFAEFGYNLRRANVSIEPFVSLGYQRYQRDTYTEKVGAAALKVLGQTQNNLNSTFGLRLAKLNTLNNGMQLTPRFSAGWKHTYGDVYSDTRQRLVTGGKNFTVSGAPLDRDSLLVDAGLDLGLSAKHTLGVGLTGEIGTDSRNHGVTGQWRMSF